MSNLITRPMWTDFRPSWVNIGKVGTVFVHHTVTSRTQEIKAACRDLEQHALSLGHRAIDYSFVVNQAGQEAEGRGWWHAGGHTINNNSTSYGIAALGNYLNDEVTDALIAAYASIINDGIRIGALSPNPAVRPHSDVFSTACPGRLRDAIPRIQALIGKTPSPVTDPTGEEPVLYRNKDNGKLMLAGEATYLFPKDDADAFAWGEAYGPARNVSPGGILHVIATVERNRKANGLTSPMPK